MLLCEVDGSAFCDSADGGSAAAEHEAAAAEPAAAEDVQPAAAEPVAAATEPAAAEAEQPAAAEALASDLPAAAGPAAAADDFIPASAWEGAKPGFAFKLGKHGLGYYADAHPSANTDSSGSGQGTRKSVRFSLPGSTVDASIVAAPPTPAAAEGEAPAAEQPPMPRAAPAAGPLPPGPRHHWGQALQYLDRAVQVAPGRKLALLARREEGRLRFALRQGVGEPVGRAPWKIEWGGGASIENPHFQRVHYCELLVSFGCVVRTWALKVCMLEALGSTPSMCGLQGNFRNFWYCWLRTLLLLVAHPAVAGCAPC